MTHNLTPADLALWAALPMAHTSNVEKRLAMILDTSRRRAFPRRFPALALTGGVAALVSMAVLHPIARGQAASPASAALSRQHRASAEPKDANGHVRKDANGHVRQVLLLKYYGEGWVETHPEAVSRAEWVRPLQAAALYGSWAEAYGGVRSQLPSAEADGLPSSSTPGADSRASKVPQCGTGPIDGGPPCRGTAKCVS